MKASRAEFLGFILVCVALSVVCYMTILSSRPRTHVRTNCLSNLKQIGLALGMYADAHQGRLPPEIGAKGLDHLLQEQMLTSLKVFVCSRDKIRRVAQPGAPLTENNCSYVYWPTAWWGSTGTNVLPVCWDKPENHGAYGMNVLFNDGHVQWMILEEWEKIRPGK